MTELKVFQIGLGSYGWHGFEKLVDMHLHSHTVDLELVGVADWDHDRLEKASNYSSAAGVEPEYYTSVDELYGRAEEVEGEVMVYDASPSTDHAEHLQRSVQKGFFHLAEKPPSMTREQQLEERKLDDAMWKADFIERESPVVKRTMEIVQGETIDSMRFYRQSSIGISKLLNPVKRSGILGGDVLDKMTHEIYLLDLMEKSRGEARLELESASSEYFMPYRPVSDALMSIDGGKAREVSTRAANGMTTARLSSGETEILLSSSWLGASEQAEEEASKADWEVMERSPVSGKEDFMGQECRFFVIEGSVNILGDMLNNRIYDLDSETEIETPSLNHDQLYRVIEKAAKQACGRVEPGPGAGKVDEFMSTIFDVREAAAESAGTVHQELEAVRQRLDRMTMDDKTFEEPERDEASA